MKQHISIDQLQELTQEQREALRELWRPELGDVFIIPENGEEIHAVDRSWLLIIRNDPRFLPLLSVGQCIELLAEKDLLQLQSIFTRICIGILPADELINVLWQAVKAVLSCNQLKEPTNSISS
ncbi:MAG: hypothetical protein ACYDG4_10670 [Desulfuromonadaceae bacterium]